MSVRVHGLLISAALTCRFSRIERHSINIAEAGEVSAWNIDGIFKSNILDTCRSRVLGKSLTESEAWIYLGRYLQET